MNQQIKEFINNRAYLFWWINDDDHNKISENLLVENILQYGTIKDIRELFEILGEQKVANIFFNQIVRKRKNYKPKTENFFRKYFTKYV